MALATTNWTNAETDAAMRHWRAYLDTHDTTGLEGQAAGIDPFTGEVWLGDSALDIVKALDQKGPAPLLFFVRIGSEFYDRKGGRR